MIAVFSTDRGWRQPLEAALREHRYEVRSASRPAELAKCLGDGCEGREGGHAGRARRATRIVTTVPAVKRGA